MLTVKSRFNVCGRGSLSLHQGKKVSTPGQISSSQRTGQQTTNGWLPLSLPGHQRESLKGWGETSLTLPGLAHLVPEPGGKNIRPRQKVWKFWSIKVNLKQEGAAHLELDDGTQGTEVIPTFVSRYGLSATMKTDFKVGYLCDSP